MKKILLSAALLLSVAAHAQSVQQSGSITPTHVSCWAANGVIKDCGSASNPFANTFGLIGGPLCINSGPVTGAYNAFCIQADSSGGVLSVYSHGGATGGFSFVVNGVAQGFPVVDIPTTVDDPTCFGSTSGKLIDCSGVGIWNGTPIGLAHGGTDADLSATGGTHDVLKQSSLGAAITVGQLGFGDLSGYAALTQGGLGGDQSAATAGQVPIYPGSSGAATPGSLPSIAGSATVAQLGSSPASHATLIDVSGSAAWRVIPDCQNTGGNHLNYTQSTDVWSCGTTGSNRILLTSSTTFYVATTGNDSTGDGSIGNPWATPIGAYHNNLQEKYDLGGQQVTIQIEDGTYTSSNQIDGKIVGQAGSVIFQGDCTTPANVFIQPATSGTAQTAYAFSVQGQSIITLQCMEVDQTNNTDPSVGSDTIAIEFQSQINIGPNFIVGNNLNQWNDYSVNGTLNFLTGSADNIFKTAVITTGSWSSGSNSITVASGSGILKYMGVSGTNIPRGAYVASISGTSVTLGYVGLAPVTATTGSGSGTTLTFTYGGQVHIDVGTQGKVLYETNGDPNYAIPVVINGYPMYTYAFLNCSQLSFCTAQALTVSAPGIVNAVPFYAITNSILDLGTEGSYYLPGAVGDTEAASATATAGSTALAVTSTTVKVGNLITMIEAPTSTFSNNVSSITVSGVTNIATGWTITAPCIAGGTKVTSVVSTTIGLSHNTICASSGAEAVVFKDNGSIIPNGTYVVAIPDGSHVTMSQAAVGSKTDTAWFGGFVGTGGQVQ